METTNLGIILGQPALDVGNTNILLLSGNDFHSQGRDEGHIVECYVWRYSDVGFFSGDVNGRQIIAMRLVAQSIRDNNRLSWVIMNFQIIVFDQFQPSSLVHVQIRLGEDILQTLMVDKDVDHIPKKIMLSHPQSKDNGSQLKIMSGIVLFMTSELSRGINNNTTFLHENIA
jgi:hypothetical protein